MASEVLEEEFQVLESIYPTELTRLSDNVLQLDVEPEEPVEGGDPINLLFKVVYPGSYPDELPDLTLEATEGILEPDEMDSLLDQLKSVGEENLGMAMTFTLVSHLREQLSILVKAKLDRRLFEEKEKERLALEEEEARTKGTPVTVESFTAWKTNFDKELKKKALQEEEERLKALTGKEREEWKKASTRFTGRQLFEHDRNLATSDFTLVEEGTVSVDVSQYERSEAPREEPEQEAVGLEFSDSD